MDASEREYLYGCSLQQAIGPVRQYGELTGTVIMVGGKNDPVPVHIEDGENTHVCEAKRDVARKLAKYLFDTPLRVVGYGRWSRNDEGFWEMNDFKIADFTILDAAPVAEVIKGLREVKSRWLSSDDPLSELRKIQDE